MPALWIATLIGVHVADYVTFVFMVARGGLDEELNPIVTGLAEGGGLAMLTMAKFAAVLLVASVYLVVGRDRPRVAAVVLAVGIFVGAFGTYSNVLTINA